MTLPRDPSTINGRHCEHVDPEAFFPVEGDMAGVQAAKKVCVGCPAATICLEFAMHHEHGLQHSARSGIFGGLSARQRAKLHYDGRAEPPTPRSRITDTKECEACKATIRRHKQSKEGWAKLRFCSKACHGLTMRYQGMPETKDCAHCGAQFGQKGRHGKAWLAAKFCSNTCSYSAQWPKPTTATA